MTAIEAGGPQFVEALGLWSQPGVFSWNRIDPGSALLAEQLPPLAGRGADLGCGAGALSIVALASPEVSELSLIDIDRRAIEAARRNIKDARARFFWADARRGDADLKDLDFIVMNPPFHDGGAEDQSLGKAFIQSAAKMLRKGGALWFTANRHLPYEAVMKPLFRAHRAENRDRRLQGFRGAEMSRPAALRLDRLLANLGYGARSQVQQLLRARRVVLDGSALDDPGVAHRLWRLIYPQRMRVNGEPLDPPPGLVLMLHKPCGVTCSHKEAGPLVYDLLPPRFRLREPAALDHRASRQGYLRPVAADRRWRAAAQDHLAEEPCAEALPRDAGACRCAATRRRFSPRER